MRFWRRPMAWVRCGSTLCPSGRWIAVRAKTSPGVRCCQRARASLRPNWAGGQHWPAPAAGGARPRVALFSTGDELVMPGEVPPEQMRPRRHLQQQPLFPTRHAAAGWAGHRLYGIVPDRRDVTIDAPAPGCQQRTRPDPDQGRRERGRGRPHQTGVETTGHAGPVADRHEVWQAVCLRPDPARRRRCPLYPARQPGVELSHLCVAGAALCAVAAGRAGRGAASRGGPCRFPPGPQSTNAASFCARCGSNAGWAGPVQQPEFRACLTGGLGRRRGGQPGGPDDCAGRHRAPSRFRSCWDEDHCALLRIDPRRSHWAVRRSKPSPPRPGALRRTHRRAVVPMPAAWRGAAPCAWRSTRP